MFTKLWCCDSPQCSLLVISFYEMIYSRCSWSGRRWGSPPTWTTSPQARPGPASASPACQELRHEKSCHLSLFMTDSYSEDIKWYSFLCFSCFQSFEGVFCLSWFSRKRKRKKAYIFSLSRWSRSHFSLHSSTAAARSSSLAPFACSCWVTRSKIFEIFSDQARLAG